jgi:hypothetical protein
MLELRYRMRVVRGAFLDQNILDKLEAKIIEKFDDGDYWISIDEVFVTLDQIKEMQKQMVKHYGDFNNPWYMDGEKEKDKNEVIVAFGTDDGEDGKIFQFERGDKVEIQKVREYGISKGIPREQMDFHKVDF